MFREKSVSAAEALSAIKKGSRVFIGSGCGEPQFLAEMLIREADRLYDVEIIQVLATRLPGYAMEKLEEHFRVKTFFVAGRGAREAVWEGQAEYIPMFMSRVPRLFSERLVELDCALIQVSPPNPHGYVSLGVSVDVAKEAIAAADLVIAQINSAMPVTLGDSFVHIGDLDMVVEHDEPLLEVPPPVLDETDLIIGGNVSHLIENGACIHAGLGRLPQAGLNALSTKVDLGVHTDMLTDGYLDLIQDGTITNRYKKINPNRVVASFCLGTKTLFDFVNTNPFVEFHPVAYTNDHNRIGDHEHMVSIHEVRQADLTGLLSVATQGNRVYSGIGGMVDYLRGTIRSPKGRFIVALRSLTEDESSAIVPTISYGGGLLASRAAAQYVVTEFGSVNLEAKSLHDRAVSLIEIAHPKFREELYSRARTEGLLSKGDPITLFRPVVYPQELIKEEAIDDETLIFRPARASDVRAIQDFFYGLDDRDIHFRFLRTMKAFPRQEMAAMANIDYHNRMTILVLKGEIGFERVVAIGRYKAVEAGDLVEVDVAVGEDYRRRGIGRALMSYIYEIAANKGFKGIVAYVAHDNPKTLKMIKSMGYLARAKPNMGIFEIVSRFDEKVDEPTMEIVYPEN